MAVTANTNETYNESIIKEDLSECINIYKSNRVLLCLLLDHATSLIPTLSGQK